MNHKMQNCTKLKIVRFNTVSDVQQFGLDYVEYYEQTTR